MTITEKIAYLKGIAEALDLNAGDKKDQLILSMLDAMNDMALSISDFEAGLDELGAQVDEIDEDLGAVEEEFYGLDDYDDCDGDCENCDEECDFDDDCVEAICPQCGAEITIGVDALESEEEIVCPECDAKLEFELVDDDQLTDED